MNILFRYFRTTIHISIYITFLAKTIPEQLVCEKLFKIILSLCLDLPVIMSFDYNELI